MTATRTSQRSVFRHIAQLPSSVWSTYDSTSLYDRSSLGAIKEDIRIIASVWFEHDAHDSVEDLAYELPLAYFDFTPHGCYSSPTRYEMEQVFRGFILEEINRDEGEERRVRLPVGNFSKSGYQRVLVVPKAHEDAGQAFVDERGHDSTEAPSRSVQDCYGSAVIR